MTQPAPTMGRRRAHEPRESWSASPLASWLADHGGRPVAAVALLDELCRRLMARGVPLWRVSVGIRTLHSEVMARNFLWTRRDGATEILRPHGIERTRTYIDSPAAAIFEGAGGFRRRLEGPEAQADFPLLRELRHEGATDYVVMPLIFSTGHINYVSWASDRAGGFSTDDLTLIYDLLPLISLRFELDATYAAEHSLLETYLGRDAANQVLAGTVRRGEGRRIRAAIWYCDLRGFTAMADALPPEELIAVLDDYFEAMARAVRAHGGEILKFVGDGMLAIFKVEPAPRETACAQALDAAIEAVAALDALNERRAGEGREPLRAGIALHLGDVVYGNVGARERLDFTVIGPAVNQVVRMEGLCASLGTSILSSDEFRCGCARRPLVSVGRHRLAGMSTEMELFTLAIE